MTKTKNYLFTAIWCSSCKVMKSALQKSNTEFIEIDIDDDIKLAKKYCIRSLPTIIVVDENENEIKRIIDSGKIKELLKKDVETPIK